MRANGCVVVSHQQQTSIPGIYAGGDLTAAVQSAIFATAAGIRPRHMSTLTNKSSRSSPAATAFY